MNQPPENHSYPTFRPTLQGCVARDLRLAHALEESYQNELYVIAAYTYRSLVSERFDRALSDLFDSIAMEEMEHFRLLGDLILALGGNPVVRSQVRVDPADVREEDRRMPRMGVRMLSDSIREEKRGIDRYQTLMAHTQDRVVRSVLSNILDDEQRHVVRLDAAMP